MGWLRDSTLRLMSALFTEPGAFAGLRQRTDIPDKTLAAELACLYYAGAVTTTAFKAAGSLVARPAEPSGRAPIDEVDSTLGRSTLPPLDAERTAPAMLLEPRRTGTGR
jgi:hypothetical protein